MRWFFLLLTPCLMGQDQITPANVDKLTQAWVYRTGESLEAAARGGRRPALEATPVFVNDTLYIGTPRGRIIALDPDTGKEKWTFDAKINLDAGYGDFANRGVTHWQGRLFLATIDARLICVMAASGTPCEGFTTVELTRGLRIGAKSPGEYEQTSPPAVVGGVVVVGSAVADNGRINMPSGEVRGFDARTGALLWTWDSIPQNAADPAFVQWRPEQAKGTGGANAWSRIVADEDTGLVFVPTGSASPDYYGGMRLGNNLYANSVVALEAATGRRVWHFQTVHHDLWDYDVASPPTLFTWRGVKAVAAGSKTGHLFFLDRATGRPLFPVQERKVPASDAPGEQASPTQPFPTRPAALAPHQFDAEEAWGQTEADRKACYEQIKGLRNEGIFTPPAERGSLIYPGNIGGMAWGGAAWDSRNNLLIVPANRLAAAVRLIKQEDFDKVRASLPGWEATRQTGARFAMARQILVSPGGLPCTPPPWSTLSAIDTATGQVRWQVPLGMPHLGGPIVTSTGLVFFAATMDATIRAFDAATGAELWTGKLPTGGRATPMTFQSAAGKQYVVIAAGGHDNPFSPPGDSIIAFRLP